MKKPRKTQDIKRGDAAAFIDETLAVIARLQEGSLLLNMSEEDQKTMADIFRVTLNIYGLEIPRRCTGEAHSNPYVDNCGVCMPLWGWVSTPVRVR